MNKKRLPSAPFVLSRVKIINQVGLLKKKKKKTRGRTEYVGGSECLWAEM